MSFRWGEIGDGSIQEIDRRATFPISLSCICSGAEQDPRNLKDHGRLSVFEMIKKLVQGVAPGAVRRIHFGTESQEQANGVCVRVGRGGHEGRVPNRVLCVPLGTMLVEDSENLRRLGLDAHNERAQVRVTRWNVDRQAGFEQSLEWTSGDAIHHAVELDVVNERIGVWRLRPEGSVRKSL